MNDDGTDALEVDRGARSFDQNHPPGSLSVEGGPDNEPCVDMGRLVVLHARLSGYMVACLSALKRRTGADILLIRYPVAQNAPFDERYFADIDHVMDRTAQTNADLVRAVDRFRPDAVLMSGWFDQGYLAVARHMRARGVPVVAGCDTQWDGSWRQHVGRLIARWYLHPAIDVLWVAGERQRRLARRLGYTGARCWSGCYSCDWSRFASEYNPAAIPPKRFLFAGRYIAQKGIDTLLAAYRKYRRAVDDPWPLHCAGAGPKADQLHGVDGVTDKGFVQPDALPALMGQAGAFILPSRREPWGVVVHEATAAGVPVLCSTASGAGVHLVREGYNGFLFEPEDATHLTRLMIRLSQLDDARRKAMSQASHALSQQYTPERWAATFVEGVHEYHNQS